MLDESVNGLEQAAARQSRKPGGETSAVVSASAYHAGNGMKVVSGGLKGVLGKSSSHRGWEVVTAPSLPQFKVSLDNPLRLMVGFWSCSVQVFHLILTSPFQPRTFHGSVTSASHFAVFEEAQGSRGQWQHSEQTPQLGWDQPQNSKI